MKYTSVNEPNEFSFHDAFIKKIRIEGSDMIWTVEAANAEKSNSQNDHDTAMCIESAEVIFKNYRITSLVSTAYKTYSDGTEREVPEKWLTEKELAEYIAKFIDEDHPGTIFSLDRWNSFSGHMIEIVAEFENVEIDYPVFRIFCTDFIVCWDNFDGTAWYEDEKWKSYKREKPTKIILATNNKNKLREVREILEPAGIEVISQSEAGADIEVEENGKTFGDNAYLKAKAVFDLTRLPVIADDSGLEVDALNGAPGVFSARYAPEGQRKKRLLEELKNVPDEKRGANFTCCICYIYPTGEARYFTGKVFGKIGYENRGTNGFGYDPIFMYGEKSFAEISAEEKNEVSHRANALKQLKEFFNN